MVVNRSVRTFGAIILCLWAVTCVHAETPDASKLDKRSAMYPAGPHALSPTFTGLEYDYALSYRNNSGSVAGATKHVFRTMVNPEIVNDALSPYGGPHANSSLYEASGGTKTNAHVGSTCPISVTAQMYVVTPSGGTSEMGRYGTSSPIPTCANVPLSSTSGDTAPGLAIPVTASDYGVTNLVAPSGSSVIGTGNITMVMEYKLDYYYLTTITPHYTTSWVDKDGDGQQDSDESVSTYAWDDYTWEARTDYYRIRYDLNFTKNVCTIDASVDSRKAFGQPNLGGELPGDPNAPQRPVNFGSWIYRGGLFLGNVNYSSTGDQSGVARIQLVNPYQGQGSYMGAVLSMLPMRIVQDSGFTTSIDIAVYLPRADDPNRDIPESEMRWDTKWDVQPDYTNPPAGDYSKRVFKLQNITPSIHFDTFLNIGIGSSQYATSTTDFSHLCLTLYHEPTIVSNGTPCWVYFASKEFPTDFTTVSPGDVKPRVWRMGLVSNDAWLSNQ